FDSNSCYVRGLGQVTAGGPKCERRASATARAPVGATSALDHPFSYNPASFIPRRLSVVPTTISHYRTQEKLGAGGIGKGHKTYDTQLERTVAIRFLPPEELRQPGARERFLREARAAAALDHPSITVIHEIGEADGHTFIVMRYVQGETLTARLRRAPVSIHQAIEWAIQIGDALAEAHARGIVHRDIKSSNIMITPRNQVQILDFGLAKKLPEALVAESRSDETRAVSDSLTQAGTVVGTVDYLAPELLRGEPADVRTDIFAFGVVL